MNITPNNSNKRLFKTKSQNFSAKSSTHLTNPKQQINCDIKSFLNYEIITRKLRQYKKKLSHSRTQKSSNLNNNNNITSYPSTSFHPIINILTYKLEHNNTKHHNGYISLNKSINGSCKLYEKMKLSQEKHKEQTKDNNELHKYTKTYINLTKKIIPKENNINCKVNYNHSKLQSNNNNNINNNKQQVKHKKPCRNKQRNFPERYISHQYKHYLSSSMINNNISSTQYYNNNNNNLHYIH